MKKELNPKVSKIKNRYSIEDSLPVTIVERALENTNISAEEKAKFFKELEENETMCVSGEVQEIVTNEGNNATVKVGLRNEDGSDGGQWSFRYPDDMTEAMLEEFKRSQNNGLCVRVCFYLEDERNGIYALVVRKCTSKIK